MDKWLLSRLESTVKAVDDNLANYRIPEAAKALQSFVADMSNWYVRLSLIHISDLTGASWLSDLQQH